MSEFFNFLRKQPALEPEPMLYIAPPTPAHPPVAKNAVANAHESLRVKIDNLTDMEEQLAEYIGELSERLRQVRVTSRALRLAFQALEEDISQNPSVSQEQLEP